MMKKAIMSFCIDLYNCGLCYGDGYNAGDLHDIEVSNVTCKTAKYAVEINAEVKDVTLENIVQNNLEGELTFVI